MSMRLLFGWLLMGLLLVACGSKKKKTMSGDESVSITDYIGFFPKLDLPLVYSDSSFPASLNDSVLISPEVYARFNPDSFYAPMFSKKEHPRFFAVGRFDNGPEEVYLLSGAITTAKKVLFISAFDKAHKFIAGMPALEVGADKQLHQSVTIDTRFNITRDLVRTGPGGTTASGRDVFVLNRAMKKFLLIMTDSLGEADMELINPIDTLPRTGKFSADYGTGKKNLISVRDGQREGRIRFFIHLEKKESECSGELKGEAVFTGPNVAEYRQGGDPCVLKFIFSKSAVTLSEVEGCGSRMGGLQCSFNGNYPRIKEAGQSTERHKTRKHKTKK